MALAELARVVADRAIDIDPLQAINHCGVVNYALLSARDPFLANLRGDPRYEGSRNVQVTASATRAS